MDVLGIHWLEWSPKDGRWVRFSFAGSETEGTVTLQEYSGQEVWDLFVSPEVDKAIAESTNEAELRGRLDAIVNGNTAVASLIAEYRPELIEYLPNAAELLQNFAGPEAPIPVPANRIDGSETQGVGPVPPPQPVELSGIGGMGGLAPSDSGGQGTASSAADGRTGGDPLILASGQLYHQVTDLATKGRGLHFVFTRTYLSQTLYRGPLGYSWDHSYNLWLREEQIRSTDGSLVNVVVRSTGQLREDRYTQILGQPVGDLPPLSDVADAIFQPPPGFFDRLEKTGGTYALQTITGVRFEYNDDFLIARILDLNGNEMQFEYTDRLLTTVRDPVGKTFVLTYDDMNRIETLTDVIGNRTVLYHYGDNGDLEEVDLLLEPDLTAGTDYRYLGHDVPFALQHNLCEVISPAGHSVLQCEYGSSPYTWEYNRVVRQRSADGEYYYEYGAVVDAPVDPAFDPINVPVSFTRIVYPNGHSVEHWFNAQKNVVRRNETVLDISGMPVELIATYRYNEDALLLQETRPDGASVEYRFQRDVYAELHSGDVTAAGPADRLGFGSLVRRIEKARAGFNETRIIVTTYDWHAQPQRLASQRGPFYGNLLLAPLPGQVIAEIHYDYDLAGNVIRISFPVVDLPDGTHQTPAPAEFHYDEHGSLTRTSVGSIITQYAYFPDLLRSGFVASKTVDSYGLALVTRYDVDVLGRITRVVEPYGATTDIEYTTFDAPKLVTLPEVTPNTPRPAVAYRYDGNRQVVEIQETIVLGDGLPHPDDALVQRFYYDEYGRLVRQRLGPKANPSERTRFAVLNSSGLPEREIDFKGSVTRFAYNERLLVSAITRGWGTAEESTRRFRYNTSGEVVALVNGLEFVTVVERDGFGRPRVIRDPDQNEFTTEYDAVGRAIVTEVSGIHPETGGPAQWSKRESRFDAVGRLVETVDHLFVPGTPGAAALVRTLYFHDELNRLVAVVAADGGMWQFEFDGVGRLIDRRNPNGDATVWRYDDVARSVEIIETNSGTNDVGASVTHVFRRVLRFDRRGLLTEEGDSAGNLTRFSWDSREMLTRAQDAADKEYFTDHDVYGQSAAYRTMLSGSEIRIELRYDANGNLREAISPTKGTTTWEYDALDRVILASSKSGLGRKYQYDAEDRLVFEEDENGTRIIRSYTPAGLLSAEEPDVSAFVPPVAAPEYTPVATLPRTFRYTPAGRLAIAHGGSSEVVISYDSLGRVVAEREGQRLVQYGYDAIGRLTRLVYPGGRAIQYTRSPAGGLVTVAQETAGLDYPGYSISPSSHLLEIWRVGELPIVQRSLSGIRTVFHFDTSRRLVGADWTRLADGAVVFRERNLYGSRGEWRVHYSDSILRLFSYDELARLIDARDYPDFIPIDVSSLTPAASEASLDSATTAAEIASLISSIQSATTGVTSVRSFVYALDPNANRLASETSMGGGPSVITPYVPTDDDQYATVDGSPVSYDRSGNMIDDGTNTYRYDAFHQLAEISYPTGTTHIVRDALSRAARVEGPVATSEFVYAGPRPVEWREGGIVAGQLVPLDRLQQYAHLAYGGQEWVPLADRLDSVIGWLSSDGSVLSRSVYDPFGRVLERTPLWPAPFGFAGYHDLGTASLYELPGRTYHSSFGRFLQRDPLGLVDGMNRYAYSHHAPGTLVDRWGFASTDIDWGTVAWEATKTAAVGGAVVAGTSALIGAGVVSAPFALVAGGLVLVGVGMMSFFRRAEDAFQAGKTDFEGRAAFAALGDTVGVTNIVEGAQGRDAVTDRVLGGQERSERLGAGLGAAGTARFAGRFARFGGNVGARANPYTVPSISRPSAYNPIVFGKYTHPRGVAAASRGTDLRGNLVRSLSELYHDTRGSLRLMSGKASTSAYKEGSFSIIDWSGYPQGRIRPKGPFRLISGREYDAARFAANEMNFEIGARSGLQGSRMQVHEVQPVKFGGNPTDWANKEILPMEEHWDVSAFWNKLQRDVE